MLDLASLTTQTDAAARVLGERRRKRAAALERALAAAQAGPQEWQALLPRLRTTDTAYLVALSNESPATAFPSPPIPDRSLVVATDGSQIAPDRHDGLEGCGLIQIGRVRLVYGTGERARLDAVAEVFFEDDEDDGRAANALALRRLGREMQELGALAAAADGAGLPAVALTDGSLIAWALAEEEDHLDPARRAARDALLAALDRCQEAGVPAVGYVSGPGSRDVINALALASGEDLRPATDADLFGHLLAPGERSPLFSARGRRTGYPHVLNAYGEHWIAFFYLHVGAEIARIELPAWAADDAAAVERVHALCLDQAGKGRGYPVALAEAHEQAVVRAADRQAFLGLLARASLRAGAPVVGTRKAYIKRVRPV